MSDDLIERLLATKPVVGPAGSAECAHLRNPDGPEAAAELRRLSTQCEGLWEALRQIRKAVAEKGDA